MEHETTPTPDEGLVLDHDHPWPGLLSFTEANQSYFFGREREVNELFRLVRQETLTVFFGKSGLGKSSILRAGLFPRLREADFVPIYVRLNHTESAPPLEDQVDILIEEVLEQEGIEARRPKQDENLWEYFHRKNDWWDRENRLVKPVLIFDQFEELLTLGQENSVRASRTASFLTELEDLIKNRPPASLVERLKEQPNLADEFDLRRSDYRVILALREDFLPDLEGLREQLSPIMTNRLRLLPMDGEQALAVVLNPSPDLVDESGAVRIVDFVSSSERSRLQREVTRAQIAKRAIEPALLCVVLQELNRRRIQAGNSKITAEAVGQTSPSEIFHDFYVRGLQGLEENVREFIEACLLTSSGARNRIAEEDALTRRGISADVISKLIDRRIVQRETTGKSKWLELTHDTLADVVRTDRTEHAHQRELRIAAEHEAEARLKLRRTQRLAVFFLVLLIVAVGAGAYAVREKLQVQSAQDFTMTTWEGLVGGILGQLEKNPSIRTSERLALIQQLDLTVEKLRNSSPTSSDLLKRRHADLLVRASLMLFDARRIDEATEYANKAERLIVPSSPNPTDLPLIAQVHLSMALAQVYAGHTDESLATLTRADAETSAAPIQKPADALRSNVLKAEIAAARARALSYTGRNSASDEVAKKAISRIEREFAAINQDNHHTLLQRRLIHELLELYTIRSRVTTSPIAPIKAAFDKALETAKRRFPPGELWTYFDADSLEMEALLSKSSGTKASFQNKAIEKLYRLLSDDPQNMRWRFELGQALASRGQSQDLDAVRRISATLRRDQRNQFLSLLLTDQANWIDDSGNAAASFLARVNLEQQRGGNTPYLTELSAIAHSKMVKFDVKNKKYGVALQDADAAFKALDRLTAAEMENSAKATMRVEIIESLLSVEADQLGRIRWLALFDAAQSSLRTSLDADPKDTDALGAEGYVLAMRADQYVRDGQHREAVATFRQAASAAVQAIDGKQDTVQDVKNYLYYQLRIIDSDGALSEGDDIKKVCHETSTRLAAWLTKDPAVAAVYPRIAAMGSALENLRKSSAKQRSGEAAHAVEIFAEESAAFQKQSQDFKQSMEGGGSVAQEVPRIDLQQFALNQWHTGNSDDGDYWLVKPRLGWAEAPIFPCLWQTQLGRQFDDAASLVESKTGVAPGKTQRIRTCPLNFYEDGRLIEAEYLDSTGDSHTVAIVSAKGATFQLDGSSPSILGAKAGVRLQLRKVDDVAAFLRFFCAYLHDNVGAFPIVETTRDLPWMITAAPQLKDDVSRLLRPLVVWPGPAAQGDWRATATIQHGTGIFHGQFQISSDGVVHMTDDLGVAKDLPLNPAVYMAGARSGGKLESFDLSIIGAPSKKMNDVEELLSVAESNARPSNYLDLAEDAAKLQMQISATASRHDPERAGQKIQISATALADDPEDDNVLDVLRRTAHLYAGANRYPEAIRWYSEVVGRRKNALTNAKPANHAYAAIKADYLKALLNLSWYQLMGKDFTGALSSTEVGNKVEQGYLPLEANHAHSLLFLGKTREAEDVYRKYVGRPIEKGSTKSWEQIISEDLDTFEKARLGNPGFAHVREILKAPSTSSPPSASTPAGHTSVSHINHSERALHPLPSRKEPAQAVTRLAKDSEKVAIEVRTLANKQVGLVENRSGSLFSKLATTAARALAGSPLRIA